MFSSSLCNRLQSRRTNWRWRNSTLPHLSSSLTLLSSTPHLLISHRRASCWSVHLFVSTNPNIYSSSVVSPSSNIVPVNSIVHERWWKGLLPPIQNESIFGMCISIWNWSWRRGWEKRVVMWMHHHWMQRRFDNCSSASLHSIYQRRRWEWVAHAHSEVELKWKLRGNHSSHFRRLYMLLSVSSSFSVFLQEISRIRESEW